MKVLFVQGGLPSYFKLLLNRLSKVPGLEVSEIIPSGKGKTLGSGVQEDYKNIDFKLYELEEYKAWYGKAFFKDFEQGLTESGADVIVIGWPYMLQFVFNPSLLKRVRQKGIKIIYRDIPFNIPYYGKAAEYFKKNLNRQENLNQKGNPAIELLKFRFLTLIRKKYLHLADAHLYYTDESRNIIGSYGIPDEKIFVSANSPDTDVLLNTFQQLKKQAPLLEPNRQRLIHVGRLVRWKRVDLILEALADLKENFKTIELLVAGYGPEEENLKEQARMLGIENKVRFLGGVYDPLELGKYLNESAIYVLAGMGGLSINDAMCFAKPVICSEADGTEKRLVRENWNGFYFSDGDKGDLAKKIEILLSDPEKISLFGSRSLEIIEKEVNIHTVLREYINAFNFATGNRFGITYQA